MIDNANTCDLLLSLQADLSREIKKIESVLPEEVEWSNKNVSPVEDLKDFINNKSSINVKSEQWVKMTIYNHGDITDVDFNIICNWCGNNIFKCKCGQTFDMNYQT